MDLRDWLLFGVHHAGGSDSSAYLNQARLLASGRLLAEPRLPELPSGPHGPLVGSPLGFRPAPNGSLAPTYPPGYPLLLAPLMLVDERLA